MQTSPHLNHVQLSLPPLEIALFEHGGMEHVHRQLTVRAATTCSN